MKWKSLYFVPLVLAAGLATTGCEGDGGSETTTFPEFRDANGNAINDHVKLGTHFVSPDDPRRHAFLDRNGDAICDLAQQPAPVWHGPGYIDTDRDGICDYWDRDSHQHQQGRRDIVRGSDFHEDMGPGMHHQQNRSL